MVALEQVPQRAVGEVVCRTPQVMIGYWNLPEASARAIRDGWFHTGDAGYLDDQGRLVVVDRVRDMAEGEIIEQATPSEVVNSPSDPRTQALIERYRSGGA